AMDRARRVHPDLDYAGSVLGAARDADVLLLLTEWPEVSAADPEVLAKTGAPRAIVGAPHAPDAGVWRRRGRGHHAPGPPRAARPHAVSQDHAGGTPDPRDGGTPDPRDGGNPDPRDGGTRDAERCQAEVACLAAAI